MSYPQHILLKQRTKITLSWVFPAAYWYQEKVDFPTMLPSFFFFLMKISMDYSIVHRSPFLALEAHN